MDKQIEQISIYKLKRTEYQLDALNLYKSGFMNRAMFNKIIKEIHTWYEKKIKLI